MARFLTTNHASGDVVRYPSLMTLSHDSRLEQRVFQLATHPADLMKSLSASKIEGEGFCLNGLRPDFFFFFLCRDIVSSVRELNLPSEKPIGGGQFHITPHDGFALAFSMKQYYTSGFKVEKIEIAKRFLSATDLRQQSTQCPDSEIFQINPKSLLDRDYRLSASLLISPPTEHLSDYSVSFMLSAPVCSARSESAHDVVQYRWDLNDTRIICSHMFTNFVERRAEALDGLILVHFAQQLLTWGAGCGVARQSSLPSPRKREHVSR